MNASGSGGCGVSYSHTTEEKPRLQIQADQVLSLLFYEEQRAAGTQELPRSSRPKGSGGMRHHLVVGSKTVLLFR